MLQSSLTLEHFDAVLFDLDGVITPTANLHALSWQRMFDPFLEARSRATGEPWQPLDIDQDYKRYLDGRIRYEAVAALLASRQISLPYGASDDAPGHDTICALGNLKDKLFDGILQSEDLQAYPGSIALIEYCRTQGFQIAVVSSSRNCEQVLRRIGLIDWFPVRIDGIVAEQLNLPGKPAPDTYIKAAAQLGIAPQRAVVIEDAIAGVQAGRAGEFGLVVGVDRHGDPDRLWQQGADCVVQDLADLLPRSQNALKQP
ncbi:HAD family hydrolase [Trichothermofontia sp.]